VFHDKAIILDVEVNQIRDKYRIKFLAIIGETGPELLMPRSLAEEVYYKLGKALNLRTNTVSYEQKQHSA